MFPFSSHYFPLVSGSTTNLVFLYSNTGGVSLLWSAVCGKLSQHDPHHACRTMRRMTTIYIEIYIIGGNDGMVGLKCAILSTIT